MKGVILMRHNRSEFYAGYGLWSADLQAAKLFKTRQEALVECERQRFGGEVELSEGQFFLQDVSPSEVSVEFGQGKSNFFRDS
jgi:hypothetical protein